MKARDKIIELVATLKAPSLLIIGVEQFYKHYMSDCSKHKAILLVNKNHKIVNRYWVDTASRFHLKYEKINLAFAIHVVL